MRKTKIICTMGPSIYKKNVLIKLFNLNVDVFRINMSHGSPENFVKYIENIRHVEKISNKIVSILLDTKGPEIRVNKFANTNKVLLKREQLFSFICKKNILGSNTKVGITYLNLINEIKINDKIFLDDGLLVMEVIDICPINKRIYCKVLHGGYLYEHKSINIPGRFMDLSFISSNDQKDLIFACNNCVDYIALSFVRTSIDVEQVREFLNLHGGKNIKIISKIESSIGLMNIDRIIEVSDGIMVARGDLGVEIPLEKVILVQKDIIKQCILKNRICITATHMLESMVNNIRPTRAEAGDISNAILDGTDAVMLSAESAKGCYPVTVVKIMAKICNYTDNLFLRYSFLNNKVQLKDNITEKFCYHVVSLANSLNVSWIILFTNNYKWSLLLRKFFSVAHILYLTTSYTLCRHLILIRNIYPYLVDQQINTVEQLYNISKKIILNNKLKLINSRKLILLTNLLNYRNNTLSICKLNYTC